MILFSGININICKRIYKQVYKPLHMPSGRGYRYKSVVLHNIFVFDVPHRSIALSDVVIRMGIITKEKESTSKPLFL